MKTRCVVVIGHVDHGKTTLVRALTGTDTDRLPEEKVRGLSITPGFAHHTYTSGVMDFVDAPGHADFIQGMVSGASGAQAALIVISLADGIRAQTREHLSIAALLGISDAVIALSKCDVVDPSEQETQLSKIRAALSQTPYARAPLIPCSAHTGDGIAALHDALNTLLEGPPKHPEARYAFLPIDRAFTLPGRGTIVTGTLLGQDLSQDDAVLLQPAGRAVTIRSLESRGVARQTVHAGERMAANLRGVTANEIPSGSVLCAPGIGTPSQIIDIHLTLLPMQNAPLKHLQQVRILFGTNSSVGQIRLIKDQNGATAFAQLRFPKPVVCFPGQKAILRRLSPAGTLGGACILDPQAEPTKSRNPARLEVLKSAQQRDTEALANALIAAGDGCAKWQDISHLARLSLPDTRTALGPAFQELDQEIISSSQAIASTKTELFDALAAYHAQHPLRSMAPRATIENPRTALPLRQYVEDRAVADNQLRRNANMLALWDHDPVAALSPDHRAAMAELEAAFLHAGLNPTPPQDDQNPELMQLLIDTRVVLSLPNIALKQTLMFHAEIVAQAAVTLANAFPQNQLFTTSQARSALNTSRRIIVPLLEHFDSLGLTLRHGDQRQCVVQNEVPPSTPP